MKKSLRFISLFIAVLFMLSGAIMIVCGAVGEEGDSPVEAQEPVMQDEPVNDPEPVNEPEPVIDDNQSSGGVDNNSGSGVDYGSDNSDDTDNSGYSSGYSGYVDEDPIYYGNSDLGYEIENVESAGAVSSSTPLYNTSGMSAADAEPNEWSDIVLDEKTVKTGVADFSTIKSNTETQDNGDWILYLGYALLALAGLGILYFIIATIAHRKAVRKAERLERRRASSPARSEAARMDAKDRRAASPSGRTSRFADESTYSRRVSSRADTDEVYVPRRAAKKH